MIHANNACLDVLLVNQTANTLQNLCIDFATLGDLKIVERPSVYTIAPHGFQSVKATIKVSSTETGVIFGSILWEGQNLSESCVILNDIHIDIMDYIKPAFCNESQVILLLQCSGVNAESFGSSEPCGLSSSGRTGSTLTIPLRMFSASPPSFRHF
jgi:vesicle coat complex subunit